MTSPTSTDASRASTTLSTSTMNGGGASLAGSSPSLWSVTASTTGAKTTIDLAFSSAMTLGTGTIFVTDGQVQTVIDRDTGLPKLRIVGATHTREIPVSQATVDGTHVKLDVTGLLADHQYNVYMGFGTLIGSGGKPFAGVTTPGAPDFTTPGASSAPAPTATIALDGASLKSGQDIFVEIKFSKPVSVLDPSALYADNANIGTLSTHDNGLTWVATLSGAIDILVSSNVLRLDMSKVVADDGGRGAGTVLSTNYAVDTLVTAYVGSSIVMGADNGPYWDDGVTNEDAMDLYGLVYGALKDGERFELVINGRVVDPVHIKIVPTMSPDLYAWSYDSLDELPDTSPSTDAIRFNQGANSVVARIVNASGYSSVEASQTITVETDSPDIVSSPHGTTVDLSQAIVIKFDEAVYWEDGESTYDTIRVLDSFGNTSWIDIDSTSFSADRTTLTINPGEHGLATGNNYRLYMPEELTDLAGNLFDGSPVQFDTLGTFVDKAPPRLTRVFVSPGDGSYGVGDTLEFRLRFSEAIRLDADFTSPLLDLSNGKTATYAGLSDDRKNMIFTYTVAAGDDEDQLSIVKPWQLAGNVEDDFGNVMDSMHIEYWDLRTPDGYGAYVEIDTVVSAVSTPTLSSLTDTGTLGDRVTTSSQPQLTGSGAEAFALIHVFSAGVEVGMGVADQDGNWQATVATPLAAGSYSIAVKQEDSAGNVSALSGALSLTVVDAPPAPPAPSLAAGSDTGIANDLITSDTTPSFTGSGAQANALVQLVLNDLPVGQTNADASGNWTIHLTGALAEGDYAFALRQLDAYGHASSLSPILAIKVQANAPALQAPPAPVLSSLSDTGVLDSDGITMDATPTYTGSGAVANGLVKLYANGSVIGQTTADGNGNWSITAGTALADGSYLVQASQTGPDNQESALSGSANLVVDTAGPTLASGVALPSDKLFRMTFSEEIVFTPTGNFELLKQVSGLFGSFLDYWGNGGGAQWTRTVDAQGLYTQLNFAVSSDGTFKLQMKNAAIQDLAGNAAIIGQPEWDFNISPTA